MLKRVRWLVTGAAVGAGGSVWAQRKLRSAVGRYGPASVANSAANRAKVAIEDGRAAMKQREAELRGRSGGGKPRGDRS